MSYVYHGKADTRLLRKLPQEALVHELMHIASDKDADLSLRLKSLKILERMANRVEASEA